MKGTAHLLRKAYTHMKISCDSGPITTKSTSKSEPREVHFIPYVQFFLRLEFKSNEKLTHVENLWCFLLILKLFNIIYDLALKN